MCKQGGRALLATALKFLRESQPEAQTQRGRTPEVTASSRIALLHNPADKSVPSSTLTQVLLAAVSLPTRRSKIPGEFLPACQQLHLTGACVIHCKVQIARYRLELGHAAAAISTEHAQFATGESGHAA